MKYIFPSIYINAISSIYLCITDAVKILFKLKKEKTDVIGESKAQQKRGPFVSSSDGDDNNGGYNLLENIVRDSLGINQNNNENNKFREINSNKYLPDLNHNNINKNRTINENNDRKNFPNSNENMN